LSTSTTLVLERFMTVTTDLNVHGCENMTSLWMSLMGQTCLTTVFLSFYG